VRPDSNTAACSSPTCKGEGGWGSATGEGGWGRDLPRSARVLRCWAIQGGADCGHCLAAAADALQVGAGLASTLSSFVALRPRTRTCSFNSSPAKGLDHAPPSSHAKTSSCSLRASQRRRRRRRRRRGRGQGTTLEEDFPLFFELRTFTFFEETSKRGKKK
jgi:hypothetical protein